MFWWAFLELCDLCGKSQGLNPKAYCKESHLGPGNFRFVQKIECQKTRNFT